MRRLAVLVLTTLVLLGAGGVVAGPAAQAGYPAPPEPTYTLTRVWTVAGGAAAQARVVLTCDPSLSPVEVWVELRRVSDGAYLARGRISNAPCTGAPEPLVLALRPWARAGDLVRLLREIPYTVQLRFDNCIERPECILFDSSSLQSPQPRRWRTPYDDDTGAELTFVRARLRSDGTVRVAYDLTCARELESPWPTTTYAAQVRGRFVPGGGAIGPTDGAFYEPCGPAVRRVRYLVSPAEGRRFGPGRIFLDTTFGEWYEQAAWAADRRVVRLTTPD